MPGHLSTPGKRLVSCGLSMRCSMLSTAGKRLYSGCSAFLQQGWQEEKYLSVSMPGQVSRDDRYAAVFPHSLQTTRVQVQGAGGLQHPARAWWNTLEAQPLAVRCSPMCMAGAGLRHEPEGISCSQRLCALLCCHLGQAPEVQLCRVAPPAPHAMFQPLRGSLVSRTGSCAKCYKDKKPGWGVLAV